MIEGENDAKKPDSLKTDKEKKDEGIVVKRNKTFMIISGVLFVLILIAGAYIVWMRFFAEDTPQVDYESQSGQNIESVSKRDYDQLNAELTACKNNVVASENCSGSDGQLVRKDFEIGSYQVTFTHPSEYYHLSGRQALNEQNIYDHYYPLAYDYIYEDMEFGEEIFLITDRSMEVYPEVSEDYQNVEIDGETYMIRKLSNGDGSFGGRSFTTYYEVELENDLYVSVVTHDELAFVSCTNDTDDGSGLPSCEDPDRGTKYGYKTTEAQLEEALEVMESFTYEIQ